MKLEGRSAIVTGGAGGLGSATVRHLSDVGIRVTIFDWDGEGAAQLSKEIGDTTNAVGGDVNDDDAVAAAIEAATALGPLSLLVNVAGGGVGGGRTVGRDGTPHDKDAFVKTLEMNATGTFNMTRFAAIAMGRNEPDDDGQRGVVVNTGSVAGIEGQAGQIAYGSAKAAILGMTLPFARDLAPLGIRVCAIAPGTMGTPKMLGVRDDLKARLVADIVFPKRMGRPEEFALLVESIARNPYLNGENIRLDGALRFPPEVATMFELEDFVHECRRALTEAHPVLAVKELLERTVRDGSAVEAALPTDGAEITPLHVSPELTVLKVVWAPGMSIPPHNHLMWAAIGLYGGEEDNVFYRRSRSGLVVSGGKQLHAGEAAALGDDTIHAVTNPLRSFTGALHVYGGDLTSQSGRSEWDAQTLEERDYDFAGTLRHFEEANRRPAGDET